MAALRSAVFNLLFFVWTAVFQFLCLPLLLAPRRLTFLFGRFWVRVSLALLAAICGLRYRVAGRANLPDGPCIVAAKHQSAWDTLIFSQLLDDPSYVIKRELLFLPLFGWFLAKLGVVGVDRSAGAKALRRMMRDARRMAAAGRKLVIFPEGTRTAPGQSRPYHPGVAALYQQLGLPVVPVALNSGLFWSRRSFKKHAGEIVLEFLPPIAPGLPRKAFLETLQGRIEEASTRLAAAGKAAPAQAAPLVDEAADNPR